MLLATPSPSLRAPGALFCCIVALVLCVCLHAPPASAQSPQTISTAKWASALGTIVPVAVGAAVAAAAPDDVLVGSAVAFAGLGLAYGPVIGHAYLGNTKRFFSSSSQRLLYVGGVTAGTYMIYAGMVTDYPPEYLLSAGIAVSAVSVGLLVYSIVADFAALDDPSGYERYRYRSGVLRVEPIYLSQVKAPGLALALRF